MRDERDGRALVFAEVDRRGHAHRTVFGQIDLSPSREVDDVDLVARRAEVRRDAPGDAASLSFTGCIEDCGLHTGRTRKPCACRNCRISVCRVESIDWLKRTPWAESSSAP